MEPVTPDPSNSQPDEWLGDDVDDSDALYRLAALTEAETALAAELDRVEGLS